MALKFISKVNCRLRFLYRKNRFLLQPFYRLLYNALIQPYFDYECSAWYPNLNNRLKSKLQILQNKCISFYLNLNSRAHIGLTEFDKINWLPTNDRSKQCISNVLSSSNKSNHIVSTVKQQLIIYYFSLLYWNFSWWIKPIFFFLSWFSFTNIHDSQDSRGRGRLFL